MRSNEGGDLAEAEGWKANWDLRKGHGMEDRMHAVSNLLCTAHIWLFAEEAHTPSQCPCVVAEVMVCSRFHHGLSRP